MRTVALAAFLLLISTVIATTAQAQTVITGPFVANTGHWNTLPNGGFETATTDNWTPFRSNGNWEASSLHSFQGGFSAAANTTTSFSGPGYAIVQNIAGLTVGQQYVLSGFFWTGDLTTGDLYLDLNDIANDPNTTSIIGVREWQFAYRVFTASSTTVTVRLVRDSNFLRPGQPTVVGQQGFIDEVAVTPQSSFVLPTISAVPEPGSAALLLVSSAVAGLCWRLRSGGRARP